MRYTTTTKEPPTIAGHAEDSEANYAMLRLNFACLTYSQRYMRQDNAFLTASTLCWVVMVVSELYTSAEAESPGCRRGF